MDYKEACKLLDLQDNFNQRQLKKAYYKMALKYHPDKNPETEEQFKEIGDAYIFLQNHKKMKVEIANLSYSELIKKIFNMDFDSLINIKPIELVFHKGFSLKIFEKLRKELAINVYQLVCKYNEVLSITPETLSQMKEILHKKMKKDNLIILNPTIDDLLEDKVYKLKYNNEIFFCPLWQHETCFDISGNDLIIKCIPELDSNKIKIDNMNNIIYKIERKISDVFKNGKIEFQIGKKKLIIYANCLRITKRQSYVFRDIGILRQNEKDIYDISKRMDIIVDIQLNF